MTIFETLAPLILLIVLGAGLARMRFLGREFMADLNKLAFWIALPAWLFSSASRAQEPAGQTALLVGLLVGATVAITLTAWGVCVAMRIPRPTHGTLMQAAFRGNLSYIGVPVVAYSFAGETAAMATAAVVMVLLMAFYNALAVVVLQSGSSHGSDWKNAARAIATNPLLVSGLLGLVVAWLGIPVPGFFDRALGTLGVAAVPIALLCIGGSLAVISLRGRRSWIVAAAALKVGILPLIVFVFGRWAGLGAVEMRIAMVFAACPTAAASYVMACQMGGDEALASGSIALSTILAVASLATALWVTG